MVKNAIQSIIESDYNNFNVAFIDDGSEYKGIDVVKEMVNPDLLEKFIFYDTKCSKTDKEHLGGSIFGKYANMAIERSDADIGIMLCDDDALLPDYMTNLNKFFNENPDVNHCYSNVLFYDPTQQDYKDGTPIPKYRHPNLSVVYAINNYNDKINGYCKIDSSQVGWRLKCNKENNIWFPFPQTHSIDAALYRQLYEKCGPCYPTGFFGQYKGAFLDQLSVRMHTPKPFDVLVDKMIKQ